MFLKIEGDNTPEGHTFSITFDKDGQRITEHFITEPYKVETCMGLIDAALKLTCHGVGLVDATLEEVQS